MIRKKRFILCCLLLLCTIIGTFACAEKESETTPTQPDLTSDMIHVQGGTFMMGTNEGEDSEKPMHNVTVNSFYIGKYEVTKKDWQELMGSWDPDPQDTFGIGDNYPVYWASWNAVIKYCNLRSLAEGLNPVYRIAGSTDSEEWGPVPNEENELWDSVTCDWNANGYRLPTEAEWEFAARGGNKSNGYKYSGSNELHKVAWYEDNSAGNIHPVGMKQANELGIHDMSGNLWEWCWDWYNEGYYSQSPSSDPRGASSGYGRVLRGGSFLHNANGCRVEERSGCPPYNDQGSFTFRLCRSDTD